MSSPPSVLLLSGPNLRLLGTREPQIYGTETLDDHVERARAMADELGLTIDHLATNAEAEAVEAVHRARRDHDAIIVNPGAFTHYSWALHDALAAFDGPVIELHLSNPDAREPWRRTSVIAPVAKGTIAGFGGFGYELAVRAVRAVLPTS
ncbi:MAG: type II 3-dehydroquinate dehydratase [Actinomycetota bacterium]|nr:type II 3-dehydroquinate dehydratase [Actinomycetota bacterium]